MSTGISEEVLDEMLRVCRLPNLYIWGNWKLINFILEYVRKKGNMTTTLLCWHKTNPVPVCNNKYLNDTEYCLHIRAKGVKLYGGYEDSKTYWVSPLNVKDKHKYGHPTIKPLAIIEQLIKNSSVEGDTVLDPYLGSGTTALACADLKRNFIGCEIDETYYNTAIKRVNDHD